MDKLVTHCSKALRSTVINLSSLTRFRSYSLDGWLNCSLTGGGFDLTPETYPWAQLNLSTMHRPSPSGVFGFIDEHEQSIDAGPFLSEQPGWVFVDSTQNDWNSLPADRHNQGCNLSFLDGHVEHWRWKTPKVYKGPGSFLATPSGDLEDHHRLQEVLPHDVVRELPLF
jgi:prepilin-type processing-associated H-X9-DG protein